MMRMLSWLLFALLAALGQSVEGALSKKAGSSVPKVITAFWSSLVAALLTGATVLSFGVPAFGPGFWSAAIATAIINVVAFPLLLQAYEWGELSSVFPMLLLTPVFMVGTSYIMLGESVTFHGLIGMLIAVAGLFMLARASVDHVHASRASDNRKGILFGLLVAFLYSISANFDKLVLLNSNRVVGPAVVWGLVMLGYVPLLFFKRDSVRASIAKGPALFVLPTLIGFAFAGGTFVYYTALGLGSASYTILVKRMSVIFGIVWGHAFFNERNLGQKLIGALIAVSGLAVMLLG